MPIYLKRTLFIGMGGTGAMALLHTKKRFLDTYGEVPAMIDFLVIDTDRNTGIKSVLERENILSDVHKNTEEKVRFSQSELIHSAVTGASAKYERNKNSLFLGCPKKMNTSCEI
jgi:CO dehydrogenase nickel-insertion accessory protein CooC1